MADVGRTEDLRILGSGNVSLQPYLVQRPDVTSAEYAAHIGGVAFDRQVTIADTALFEQHFGLTNRKVRVGLLDLGNNLLQITLEALRYGLALNRGLLDSVRQDCASPIYGTIPWTVWCGASQDCQPSTFA